MISRTKDQDLKDQGSGSQGPRIRILRTKDQDLLGPRIRVFSNYHAISSSGSPRLLVAFSSGAGSKIPHLMSERSKVVLQVRVKISFTANLVNSHLGKLHCWTLSCWVELLPVAPLCKVIVWPETKRFDTPPVSSSHGWGKLGEVEKELEEVEKTRLAAAEVEKVEAADVNEGEDWNWEVGVPPPLVVLFSSS